MKSLFFISTIFIVFLSGARASAADSNTEAQLRQTYVGSQRLLRHFYDAATLTFDSDGNPTNKGKEGPWTLWGDVIIEDLHLKSSKLEMHGHRNMLVIDDQNKKLRAIKLGKDFYIEIELKAGADQSIQLPAALERVFVPSADLATAVPNYWQDYTARLTGKQLAGKPCGDSKPGNEVTLPEGATAKTRVSVEVVDGLKIHDVTPLYPLEARKARVQGQVMVQAKIDKSGTIGQFCILQAIGAGLDDSAMDAIRQWKYRPYVFRGEPWEVETTIKVQFALH